jgi:hypothetical protein
MARRKKSAASRGDDLSEEPILKRPDGFYWQRKSGELRGPFVTRNEAAADRLAGGLAEEDDADTSDLLHEAEFELGMSEWIDPDTGGPAEDNVPRLEDH